MSALICGSMAFDNIMVYPGRFRDHILPDRIHILNVAFLVPEMRREFGGCAGNVVYNLRLLGGEGVPMATVGRDFDPYRRRLEDMQIATRYVRTVPDEFTAQAYITTDVDDNQITAFHPGAMNHSHLNHVPSDAGITLGLVAPDGRDGMLQHAREFDEAGIPFIFDPGQGLPMFDADELGDFIERARWIIVNDYEAGLLEETTGLPPGQIAERVDALIVTRGGKGSVIYAGGHRIEIPAVDAPHVADPTGCGDAYRAGVIFGLMRGADWATCGRIGSLMGALKVAAPGTQNHVSEPDAIRERFQSEFGYPLGL